MGEHNGSINCQEMPWDLGTDAAHIERETENSGTSASEASETALLTRLDL